MCTLKNILYFQFAADHPLKIQLAVFAAMRVNIKLRFDLNFEMYAFSLIR